MGWKRGSRLLTVVGLSVGVAACGDGGPSSPGTPELTEAEAGTMMNALVNAGGLGLDVLGAGGFDGQAAPPLASATMEYSDSHGCPGGGVVHVEGVVAADEETQTVSVDLTQTHDGCTGTASSDGSQWTFDGAPNVTTSLTVAADETSFQVDGQQVGEIAWQTGNRSGTCAIDLAYEFSGSQSGQAFSGSIAGTVCGHSISQSIDVDD